MKRIIAVFLCLITMILCIPEVSAAENNITSQEESFQIVINENGNAHVIEKRNYYFGGDATTFYQSKYKLNGHTLKDFHIYFDDNPMSILDNPDDSRPQGCAAIYTQNGECFVDLYLNCLNESH